MEEFRFVKGPPITVTASQQPLQALVNTERSKLELLEQRMGVKHVVSSTPEKLGENEVHYQHSTSDSEVDNMKEGEESTNHSTTDDGSGTSKPRKKRKNYTQDEDTKLQEGVKKFGTEDWQKIVDWGGFERSAHQLKDRFKRIKRKTDDLPGNKRRKLEDGNGKTSPNKEKEKEQHDDLDSAIRQVEKEKKQLMEHQKTDLVNKELALQQKEDELKKREEHLQQQLDKEHKVEKKQSGTHSKGFH